MVLENVPVADFILELGKLGKWIQAVGLLVILWIIIQSITLCFNRRRRLAIYSIKKDLKRIEEKVDKISRKINKK